MEPKRDGYSRTQIILHWTIAVLILLQFLNQELMEAAWHARTGTPEPGEGSGMPFPHIIIGVVVLLLAVWRLTLRLRRGVPGRAPHENTFISLAAKATHIGLYALIFLMPLTGALAWFGGVEVSARIHVVLRWVLFWLVVLHIAGALFEQFVLRSNVLRRITRPQH